MKILYLLLGIVWFFFFEIFSFCLGSKALSKKENKPSPLRYFPNEYFGTRNSSLSYAFFLLGLLPAFLPLALLTSSLEFIDASFQGYLLFGEISILLFLVAWSFLVSVSPSNEKLHFGLYLLSGLLLMVLFLSGALCFLAVASRSGHELFIRVFSYILMILSALAIPLLADPRLRRWYELEAFSNPDGSVSYRRPKVFRLAFYEWLLFLLFALGFLLFSVLAILF